MERKRANQMRISEQRQLRIAIVAENASFRFGGEASLPLHYFSRLRKRGIEVWLVVHSRTRPELDSLFPNERDRILTIPDMWLHKLLWRLGKLLPRRLSETTFGTLIGLFNQYLQRHMVRALIREQGIQLVHQPTPVSPKAPSFLSGFGIPVVIGPMNGGMEYPNAFRNSESGFTRIFVVGGRLAANLINNFIPGKKQARLLLVANQRTKEALPSCVQGEVGIVPENGADLNIWTPRLNFLTPSSASDARFLFIGRLVDWKRLDIALRALVQLPGAKLEVIGDGPMRAEWSDLAGNLDLVDRVQFVGWLSQNESAQRLQEATALILPSIFECGGAVVLEAMAVGTPVIATAWGGPADYLDQSCGILVDPTSEHALVLGFAKAMQKLATDGSSCERLGRAGRVRVVEEYDWEKKIDRMVSIYRKLVESDKAGIEE
jgi:glycosyltransferase involved in cell wall biosynthesis